MNQKFQGWEMVVRHLCQRADMLEQEAREKNDANASRLNKGQRASLRAIAERIVNHGVLIADEVGMGKTRIAVEVAHAVIESGGRVAILVPPGLGYQWQTELRDGGINDVPPIVRSIIGYSYPWENEAEKERPWFVLSTVIVSHAFTNWKFGGNSDSWRWALLPEIYAHWRKETHGQFPYGYHASEGLTYRWCFNAAEDICKAVPRNRRHPVRDALNQLLAQVRWPDPLDPSQYSKGNDLRVWLERCFGFGLGLFDLVIIDEAHKSRHEKSGLSRVLNNVILSSNTARRLAMTATPVELDVVQWANTLKRLDLDNSTLERLTQTIQTYAASVDRVRQTWRTNAEARDRYKKAATDFENALSPYVLRRDKREDPEVRCFYEYSGLPINAYRKESEVLVETTSLSPSWRKTVCAAESLSLITRQADDPVAKKLRLTLGNGHGIAALLDQINRSEEDHKQEESDRERESDPTEEACEISDLKRQERAEWWRNVITSAFSHGDESLFEHPAILAAVNTIEDAIQQGEKVLVFGRFVRPLHALVDLLNAREMLRRLQKREPWPQAQVHGNQDGISDYSEWPAVNAAHRQLNCTLPLESLDKALRTQYDRESYQRERFREHLISWIEKGLLENEANKFSKRMFDAFRRSIETGTRSEHTEQDTLVLVARAMIELLESPQDASLTECANTFCQLLQAVSDRDDAESNQEKNDEEIDDLWLTIEQRLREEYSRTQGGFARLMYGGTSQASRRMIQLAFNRPHSFPKVLVAQSMVGREGLNLHQACRIVVIIHPEWNPGVVEQQIGRVDRVKSHWCHKLNEAIQSGGTADQLPRIEVRPVIFRGTYDEHNWQVLRRRWDDFRAQLHGIVIPPSEVPDDQEGMELIAQISRAAPKFSPTSRREC